MKTFLRVSTKGHYGLALMAYLARNFSNGRYVSLKEVGASENISDGYLEEIAAMLKKKKLIKGQRGKGGGYQLSKNPIKIRILDIIETLEGPLALVECLNKSSKSFCSNKKCTSKNIWSRVQKELHNQLDKIKLGEFI